MLYLAVEERIRSRGYGTKILDWLKHNTSKIIVLNIEALNPDAENALQRERRIAFYNKNGIFDTGTGFIYAGETYSVLASDPDHYDPKEYERLLYKCSYGMYRKQIT